MSLRGKKRLSPLARREHEKITQMGQIWFHDSKEEEEKKKERMTRMVLLLKAGNASAGARCVVFFLPVQNPGTETNRIPQLNKEEAFPSVTFLLLALPFDIPGTGAACPKTEAAVEQWNLIDEIESRMIAGWVGNGLQTNQPTYRSTERLPYLPNHIFCLQARFELSEAPTSRRPS